MKDHRHIYGSKTQICHPQLAVLRVARMSTAFPFYINRCCCIRVSQTRAYDASLHMSAWPCA
eukprot:32010-Eustigmatos_ZCMA.PRE.1